MRGAPVDQRSTAAGVELGATECLTAEAEDGTGSGSGRRGRLTYQDGPLPG